MNTYNFLLLIKVINLILISMKKYFILTVYVLALAAMVISGLKNNVNIFVLGLTIQAFIMAYVAKVENPFDIPTE